MRRSETSQFEISKFIPYSLFMASRVPLFLSVFFSLIVLASFLDWEFWNKTPSPLKKIGFSSSSKPFGSKEHIKNFKVTYVEDGGEQKTLNLKSFLGQKTHLFESRIYYIAFSHFLHIPESKFSQVAEKICKSLNKESEKKVNKLIFSTDEKTSRDHDCSF